MKVQTISACQSCKGSSKKIIEQPKFICATCTKCSIDNNCEVFQRPVEPYNKCFYHSNYSPVVIVFRPVRNTDAMVEDETKKGKLTYA